MIKRWLRNWLGIEQLDLFVSLMREELNLPESIATIKDVTTGELKPNTIRKGYVKHQ
jgi:hypothetical protein